MYFTLLITAEGGLALMTEHPRVELLYLISVVVEVAG